MGFSIITFILNEFVANENIVVYINVEKYAYTYCTIQHVLQKGTPGQERWEGQHRQ